MTHPRSIWRLLLVFVASAAVLHAAETPLEKPGRYFNDFTGHVEGGAADRLNERLAQYERESSNQLLVAIYPRMLTDSSLEDYCTRTFESWGVGRKDKDNGAVLFVFLEDRKMRIQTGYGLEGSLTDAECFRIIEGIKPFFRAANYAGGATFAVDAMIAATAGEYQGTGKTTAERSSGLGFKQWLVVAFVLVWIFIVLMSIRDSWRNRGTVYDANRRYRLPGDTWWNTHPWGGGGGWGNGGGGGGFSSWSGGGGSTGGGGASGSW